MAVAPTYASALASAFHVPGDLKEFVYTGTVGAADTYVTGGFAFVPATVGLGSIAVVTPIIFSTGHYGIYVPSTGTIKVFSAAATELVNASAALQNATFVVQGLGK